MKRFLTYPGRFGLFIDAGLRYVFVVLFVYAGMSKLLDFETFQVQLAQSPLLSAYAGFVAWAVPISEFLIAILLLVERTRILGLRGFFFLMVLFTTYIVIILNFADFVPCSCGGVLEDMSWGQHLAFNIAFVLVSGVLLFFQLPGNWRRRVLLLGSQVVLGVGVVSVLFAFSERKMHRNNAFQRRYVPFALELKQSIDLKYNSYYFSGFSDTHIYLGNVTAPLHLMEVSADFISTKQKTIKVDKMDLPYSQIRLNVKPPRFYLSDGNVPVFLEGSVSDWEATTKMLGDFYFSQLIPFSSKLFFKTISRKTEKNVIGSYSIPDKSLEINEHLLSDQTRSIFDSDGQLLYNEEEDKLIYIYYYRNEYVVFDRDLNPRSFGRTIDTVTQVFPKTLVNSKTQKMKLKGNDFIINKQAATFANYLFIISERLGRHEKKEILRNATIVDVYDFLENRYAFSFYIYHFKKNAVSRLSVHQGRLYSLMENYLVCFDLNEKYFFSNKNISADSR